MSWSPVGNPGNAADTTGYGAVNYMYYIGTYDVTVSQYVAFLNANDPTGANPVGIYSPYMSEATDGTMTYNATAPAGQKYSAMAGDGNLPIDAVTWYDAVRFANWMDNGQPTFANEPTAANNATEHGSYTLLGFMPTPDNADSINRNPDAVVVLPSENEWYKAAYYNPATSSYFLYPTSSNVAPNATPPTPMPNSANYENVVNSPTDVGAYSGTTSPCGAYDMGGDVGQWNETLIDGLFRGLRGGAYYVGANVLQSSSRGYNDGDIEYDDIGFRLALVPEPSSIVLAILGCVGALALRKRLQCWDGRQT